MPTALITGASRGLGRALADALSRQGWTLVLDGRDAVALADAAAPMARRTAVHAIPGDVTDAAHRAALAGAAAGVGPIDLLVNNASSLGPTPLPAVLGVTPGDLQALFATNVVAPVAVLQAVRDQLAPGAVVLNVSSDAAVEAYPGWGGYGASKAALDHLTAVLAVERPDLHVYAVDPGDMRTAMQQAAFPDQDVSDRPAPEEVVPTLLRLLARRPVSGRYRASDLAIAEVSA